MTAERTLVRDLATWVGQQLKAIKAANAAAQPHHAVVTTNSSGTATITFPAGRFGATPIVQATPIATSTSQAVLVEIVSVTSTQVTIKTWRTQATAVLVLNIAVQPVIAAAATVHVTAHPAT